MRLATLQPQHQFIGLKREKDVDTLSTFVPAVRSFKQIELNNWMGLSIIHKAVLVIL